MKKTLIALGVAAGAIAGAQAEDTTTLYGSLGYSVMVAEDHGNDDDHIWDINTSTAKFGIKGTEDLSNGLQAFFKYEFGVEDNDVTTPITFVDKDGNEYIAEYDEGTGIKETRYAYLGLRGDFGTLTIGKQDTLFKHAVNYNDIFNEVGYKGASNGPTKIAKAVNYMTPDMSGLKLGISAMLDDQEMASDGIDAYEAGLLYDMNGFSAGLAYIYLEQATPIQVGSGNTVVTTGYADNGSDEFIGGHIGYSNDQYQVGFGAQHAASLGTYYNLAAEFYNDANTFRIGADLIDEDNAEEDWNFALGYQYNFSQRTYAWIEGEYMDYGDDAMDEDFIATVGIRHDF